MTQYNLRSTNRSQCDSFCETHQEGPVRSLRVVPCFYPHVLLVKDSCSQFLQRTDGDIVLMYVFRVIHELYTC